MCFLMLCKMCLMFFRPCAGRFDRKWLCVQGVKVGHGLFVWCALIRYGPTLLILVPVARACLANITLVFFWIWRQNSVSQEVVAQLEPLIFGMSFGISAVCFCFLDTAF